ncbi:MAG: fibronectin type III domain-containing protein [Oligoflexia bacterium]|nr:fibronectin type III domain-containing protein [Oligoflexia bacterium]
MPKGGPILNSSDVKAIFDWIQAGALNDTIDTNAQAIAPSSLAASGITNTQITLNWIDNANNESGFKVERATNINGPFTQIANIAANTTGTIDFNLTASTTYFYRVRAFNALGDSLTSNTVTAVTLAAPTTAPIAPTNLLTSAVSSSGINLTWSDNSNNETTFNIERALVSNGPFTFINSVSSNISNFSDTGLTASTNYFYRVQAVNSIGGSGFSNISNTFTNAAAITAPAAPSGLSSVAFSATQINLTWVDGSNNETGFTIESASSSGGTFTVVTTTAAGATSFSNTGIAAGTTRFYKVKAVNSAGSSSYTATSNATTFGTFSLISSTILQPKCNSCHGGSNPSGGYTTNTFAGTITRVVNFDPNNSKLYQRTLSGSMPVGSGALTQAQLELIRTWIQSGAPNN